MKNLYPDLRRLIKKRNRYFKIKKTERTIQEISTIINLSSEKCKGVQRVRQSYWSHVEEILEPRDAENNPLVLNAFGHLSNMHAAINQEFLR